MADPIVAVEKPCTRCKRVLPLAEFSPDKRTALGVGSQCKACNRERMKGYTATHKEQTAARNSRYRAEHKSELNQRCVEWWDANKDEVNRKRRQKYPVKREQLIADQVKYRSENEEYIRVRQKAYYQRTKRQHAIRLREWRKNNPDKLHAQLKRRRARIANSPEVTLTAGEWEFIKAAYGHCCAYCGQKPDVVTQDHIIPLSKGGAHNAANVVPACQSCNSSKGANTL